MLVGHDWGAAVAWQCTLIAEERVRAVVTLSKIGSWLGSTSRHQTPTPPTEVLRQTHGENFFYQLYFQEPGVAERELDADPRKLLQRLFAAADTPREPPEITDPVGGDDLAESGRLPRRPVDPRRQPLDNPGTTRRGQPAARRLSTRPALSQTSCRGGDVWWTAWDSNPRPPRCERGALPTELAARRRPKNGDCTMFGGWLRPGPTGYTLPSVGATLF